MPYLFKSRGAPFTGTFLYSEFSMGLKRELDDTECKTPSPKKSTSKFAAKTSPEKWDEEEVKLLVRKRKEGATWEELLKIFPSRSIRSLKTKYGRKVIEVEEVFNAEADAALIVEFENYQKRVWTNIGKVIGKTAGGCKKRAKELKLVP